jgi:hypothetical protein
LKLAAFKKANGAYPDQLDQLGIDAIDPYTGAEFGYRRHGFPFPVRVVNGMHYADETLSPGQPIVWSAGPANVRLFTPTVVGSSRVEQPAGGSAPRPAVKPPAQTSPWFSRFHERGVFLSVVC